METGSGIDSFLKRSAVVVVQSLMAKWRDFTKNPTGGVGERLRKNAAASHFFNEKGDVLMGEALFNYIIGHYPKLISGIQLFKEHYERVDRELHGHEHRGSTDTGFGSAVMRSDDDDFLAAFNSIGNRHIPEILSPDIRIHMSVTLEEIWLRTIKKINVKRRDRDDLELTLNLWELEERVTYPRCGHKYMERRVRDHPPADDDENAIDDYYEEVPAFGDIQIFIAFILPPHVTRDGPHLIQSYLSGKVDDVTSRKTASAEPLAP